MLTSDEPTRATASSSRTVPIATASSSRTAPSPRNFLRTAPQLSPQFASPALRAERRREAADRVIRSQGSTIPITPLRPVSAEVQAEAERHQFASDEGGQPLIPEPIRTFDPQDPGSMEAVTLIVEEVLKRLGHEGVTIVGDRRKSQARNSRRSRQTAVKLQQASMTPEDDCYWKVSCVRTK
jgi:hypothetical protein